MTPVPPRYVAPSLRCGRCGATILNDNWQYRDGILLCDACWQRQDDCEPDDPEPDD